MKQIRISSSIANFAPKLRLRYADYTDWRIYRVYTPTLFFGCYHALDYLRIIFHRGPKVLFWCGSDILALSPFRAKLLRTQTILHYVENDVEWLLLKQYGIKALIQPMFFGDAKEYHPTYTQRDRPHVFLSTHRGRGKEYGVARVLRIAPKVPDVTFHIYGAKFPKLKHPENVVFHGRVSEQKFDRDIEKYQAGLRLNRFDGFGEVIAKSILLGQHPITTIPYHGIDAIFSDRDLISKLKELSSKREPNPYRQFWFELLSKRVEV